MWVANLFIYICACGMSTVCRVHMYVLMYVRCMHVEYMCICPCTYTEARTGYQASSISLCFFSEAGSLTKQESLLSSTRLANQ